MFVRKEKPGGSRFVWLELSTREIRRWREKDTDLIREAERMVLIEGLKRKSVEYIIGGAGDLMLTHGFIDRLQKNYPDVTENSMS